jgi:hypothetical protein
MCAREESEDSEPRRLLKQNVRCASATLCGWVWLGVARCAACAACRLCAATCTCAAADCAAGRQGVTASRRAMHVAQAMRLAPATLSTPQATKLTPGHTAWCPAAPHTCHRARTGGSAACWRRERQVCGAPPQRPAAPALQVLLSQARCQTTPHTARAAAGRAARRRAAAWARSSPRRRQACPQSAGRGV